MRSPICISFLSLLLAVSIAACQESESSKELSKVRNDTTLESQNISVVKSFYRSLDSHDTSSFDKLIHNNFVSFFGSSEDSITLSELKPLMRNFYTAFPDFKHHIINIFESGDFVICHARYTGTHKGEFMNIPPTGKEISFKGVHIFKIKEGSIIELHEIADNLSFMSQIGVTPK
jgi:steroid delta-isomerase-like uncharacterized protein